MAHVLLESTMELDYTITRDDVEAFWAHYAESTSRVTRLYREIWRNVAALFGILGIGSIYLERGSFEIAFWFSLCLAWIVFGWRLTVWLIQRQRRRTIERLDVSSHIGEHRLVATDSGLQVIHAAGETRLNWSALARVRSTASHTFIFTDDISALVIPHARIRSGDVRSFVVEVQTHIASAA